MRRRYGAIDVLRVRIRRLAQILIGGWIDACGGEPHAATMTYRRREAADYAPSLRSPWRAAAGAAKDLHGSGPSPQVLVRLNDLSSPARYRFYSDAQEILPLG